jgi:hypothetical protein
MVVVAVEQNSSVGSFPYLCSKDRIQNDYIIATLFITVGDMEPHRSNKRTRQSTTHDASQQDAMEQYSQWMMWPRKTR